MAEPFQRAARINSSQENADTVLRSLLRREELPHANMQRLWEEGLMRARDIMTAKPLAVVPTDPVWKAAEIMRYEDIGGVPVVSDKATGKLVGLITDRDITVRCMARRHGPICLVLAHMTPQPLCTVHPDSDVREIVEKMEAAEVRRIPVVDDRGVLLGIVAERDLAMKLDASEALPLRKRIKAASRPALATVEVAIR